MNHRCLLNAVLATILLISLLGALRAAARPLAAIQAEGTLRVGMTGDYAPFSVRGPDGQISGGTIWGGPFLPTGFGSPRPQGTIFTFVP